MRTRLRPALAGMVVVLTAAPSWGQETLSLDQAVRQALADNRELEAGAAGVAEADAGVTAARAGWLPRVSLTETWQRSNQPVLVFGSRLAARRFGAPDFAIDALNHPESTGVFRAAVGVEQLLFDGGQQGAGVEGASLQRDIARHSLDETRAHLATSVAETYGRVLMADAGRRAAEAALEAAQQDRVRAGNRRDAGLATDADVLALDAHIADLEQRRIAFDGDAAIARASLNRLMGAPIDASFSVVEPVPASVQPGTTDLATLLTEAEGNRPELRRTAAATRLAGTERRRAGAALMPRIAAQAGIEMNGLDYASRASSWIIGAEARWSLSLGGAERARLRAASAAEIRASAEAEDARAAVHLDVVTALRGAQSAAARLVAGRAAVAQARESERIVRDRADAGLATIGDLLRASTAVLDAEARRTAAIVDALVGDARLRRALGRQP